MKATITKPFRFAADGIHITKHEPGDVVEGNVARSAVAQKCAKPLREEGSVAAKKPPANKATQPPQNKSASAEVDPAAE